MSDRKLIAYLRTIETGSITQCALDLGYTQSAVSKMIAELEREWKVTLLTRSRTGIEITSEGMSLLPAIQAIVKGYDDLNYAISELHGVKSGLLRLGCFTSLSTSILPSMLHTFHEKYPNIQFQLYNGEYSEIADWLKRGTIDCGFLTMPVSDEFDVTFLLRDSFVAILPENHPMAGEPYFPVDRLAAEPFVKLKELQDHEIDSFLDRLVDRPRVIYEVTSDFALLSMVESGLGLSVVHDLMLQPKRHRIVRLPLDVTETHDIGIAVKSRTEPSSVAKLFIQHVISYNTKSVEISAE